MRGATAPPGTCDPLGGFLGPVRDWFARTFPAPSPVQSLAWPVIRCGDSALVLAPTGSGKTLAAFLCAIDRLHRRRLEHGRIADGVHVLYITPLKALGNDIHRNLLVPLEGIALGSGPEFGEIRVGVRTGDTPQSERERMVRRPPHILITTPESLYLLLGSERMAPALASVGTVIVDEVHALCGSKRGVHLAVSLERLEARLPAPPQRIGCSATLNPLGEIARFLAGLASDGSPRPCTIVDAGMRKDMDLRVVAPLPEFVETSQDALWASAYELLAQEIRAHRTTLVFTNSRYKAERTALRLAEAAGKDLPIGVHHGSVSRERRLETEDALKSGRFRALVATASLELGIDIGSVDLVCQLESPKSAGTGLQRVGRAGHLLDATSKGRIVVFSRNELAEAAAVCQAMREGAVDATRLPTGCLDVLAQQIVGTVAAGETDPDHLLSILRRSYPYHDLSEETYQSVLRMLAGEYPLQMALPPRALIRWDRSTAHLSPARAAAQVAAMCVGTIPETAEYEVVLDDSGKRVGSVQSEFVDDHLRIGDVFVLGSTAWRVAGVRRDRLLVREAPGANPTIPWWHGPIEPRTWEVGERIGRLRREVTTRLHDPALCTWLQEDYSLCPQSAQALEQYIREQERACIVPDHETILVEYWRNESGRTCVVVHCPYGQRVNRTWGVALAARARELWGSEWLAASTNDTLTLTEPDDADGVAATPVDEWVLGLSPAGAERLVAAALPEMAGLAGAFREASVCAFQVLRMWQGTRVPLWLRNIRAQQLWEVAREHQDYPVTAEALRAYSEESLDTPGLRRLLRLVESGAVRIVVRAVDAPSPFAQEELLQDPFTSPHLTGAERRARLLRLHRQLLQEVLTAEEMAQLLDPEVIAALEERLQHRAESSRARTPDELAQVLRELGDLPARSEAVRAVSDGDGSAMLAELVAARRVVAFRAPDCEADPMRLVCTDLWREHVDAYAAQGARLDGVHVPRVSEGEIAGFDRVPASVAVPQHLRKRVERGEARKRAVARFLRSHGPVTVYEIMNHTAWPVGAVELALGQLAEEGVAARGAYASAKGLPQWVDRGNFEQIHRLTLQRLRRDIAACPPEESVDFLTRWQHLHPAHRLTGVDGLRQVVRQLQGYEAVQGAWEAEILPGRVEGYRPEWLDQLVASGEVCWRRVGTRSLRRGVITFCLQADAEWIASGSPLQFETLAEADCDIADEIAAVRGFFQDRGLAYFDELLAETGVADGAATRAVWHLAWCGELTCDTYECIRHAGFTTSLSACYDLDSTPAKITSGRISPERPLEHMRRRRLDPRLGRWSATERLVPPGAPLATDVVPRRWVEQLLDRWGVLSRDTAACETCAPLWRDLVPELKRLELLGRIRRGFFIEGHQGEQYALPEAIELLQECRSRSGVGPGTHSGEPEPLLAMTNRDPANLYAHTGLDIRDGRGERFETRQRRGNLVVTMVTQAGRPLLYGTRLLTPLPREEVARCIDAMRRDHAGRDVTVEVPRWNGVPAPDCSAAGLLWEMGFRFDGRDWLVWPPRGAGKRSAPGRGAELLPAYYQESLGVDYGRQWTVERAPRPVRAALDALLGELENALVPEGWCVRWGPTGPEADYRGRARTGLYTGRSFADLVLRVPAFHAADGSRKGLWRRFRVRQAEDVDPELIAQLRATVRLARELVDSCPAVLRRSADSRPATTEGSAGSMEDDRIVINRAPVLTLWAAVVAERLGWDPDAALSLAKAVAGLNAQAKGRTLGVYGPPKGRSGETPKVTGLGEDAWVQLCGRPVPVKSTESGTRAVVRDKPIEPAPVRKYLEGKFGESLHRVRLAMEDLAAALETSGLEESAYPLYEEFRPAIERGISGWGQAGILDLAQLRSLAARARGAHSP